MSKLNANSVEIGTRTTAERDALTSVSTGTILYNSTNKRCEVYDGTRWVGVQRGGYIEATGGVISEYSVSSTRYRAHIFTSSGEFNITSNSPSHETVDVLLVGGGGGGGAQHGGGGGAGGFKEFPAIRINPGPYKVVVGAGGRGGMGVPSPANPVAQPGEASSFGDLLRVSGGGGGGKYGDSGGQPGGSGGGGGSDEDNSTNPGGSGNISGWSPPEGNAGGLGRYAGGGGGGAGGVGSDVSPASPYGVAAGAVGGNGSPSTYAYGPGSPITYAGGGGGGTHSPGAPNAPTGAAGGSGGGGRGGRLSTGPDITGQQGNDPSTSAGNDGLQGTGGGGGGSSRYQAPGGAGASGICVVRYVIGGSEGTAKASGGAISYYDDKVIHTFMNSGTFTMPATYPSTPAQILVVGGGGAGGQRHGGGGGGGGVIHVQASNGTITNGTYTVVIGAGGAARQGDREINSTQTNGDDTTFGPPAGASTPTHLIAKGGGSGGSYPGTPGGGQTGGSGGGAKGENPSTGAPGSQPAPTAFGTSQGFANPGGNGGSWSDTNHPDRRLGGGGGGAGGFGHPGDANHNQNPGSGNGGDGVQIQIANDPGNNYWWAAGGGGGAWGGNEGQTGVAGAGDGGQGGGGGGSITDTDGLSGQDYYGKGRLGGIYAGGNGTSGWHNRGGHGGQNTGSGGGGNGQSSIYGWTPMAGAGSGGSGIVIIAYPSA